jgi:deoxycytidine triphosphate deaminase
MPVPRRRFRRRPTARRPTHPGAVPDFAASPEEARDRFEQTAHADPFPEIEPALLNSADFLDYIAATGMVYPFRFERQNPTKWVKPASCGISFAGEVQFWKVHAGSDKVSTEVVRRTLSPEDVFMLEPNVIAYVTLEPTFRMPDYLAARYNLTIQEIHRGLLVGTGPLVDPGFVGELRVPLHNLTTNAYPLVSGEPLVWMEFTKVSAHRRWTRWQPPRAQRGSPYVPFPERKLTRRTMDQYLERAHDGPIVSSIPGLTGRAEASAKRAADEARNVRRTFGLGLAVALVGLVVAVGTMVLDLHGVVSDSRNASDELSQELECQQQLLRRERARNDRQQRAIQAARSGRRSRPPVSIPRVSRECAGQ